MTINDYQLLMEKRQSCRDFDGTKPIEKKTLLRFWKLQNFHLLHAIASHILCLWLKEKSLQKLKMQRLWVLIALLINAMLFLL